MISEIPRSQQIQNQEEVQTVVFTISIIQPPDEGPMALSSSPIIVNLSEAEVSVTLANEAQDTRAVFTTDPSDSDRLLNWLDGNGNPIQKPHYVSDVSGSGTTTITFSSTNPATAENEPVTIGFRAYVLFCKGELCQTFETPDPTIVYVQPTDSGGDPDTETH